ncbi:MAG: hypothetical protein WCL11_23525 [Verrucomicrobiota bacterium]
MVCILPPPLRILAVMPQSLARILVHTVFSTKDRRPLLRVGLTTVKETTDATISGLIPAPDTPPG